MWRFIIRERGLFDAFSRNTMVRILFWGHAGGAWLSGRQENWGVYTACNRGCCWKQDKKYIENTATISHRHRYGNCVLAWAVCLSCGAKPTFDSEFSLDPGTRLPLFTLWRQCPLSECSFALTSFIDSSWISKHRD